MDVLPILPKNSAQLRQYCTLESHGDVITNVTMHGLVGYSWSEMGFCTSALTGGNFREYLMDATFGCNHNLCLHLDPLQHKFLLPCYDGLGKRIEEEALQFYRKKYKERFSPDLLCYYIYLPEEPAVILFDNADSLQRKKAVAEDLSVPLLIASEAVIAKIKTP